MPARVVADAEARPLKRTCTVEVSPGAMTAPLISGSIERQGSALPARCDVYSGFCRGFLAAAVDGDYSAVYFPGCVGCQEDDDVGDGLRLDPAAMIGLGH
jgi:hypothetical protein